MAIPGPGGVGGCPRVTPSEARRRHADDRRNQPPRSRGGHFPVCRDFCFARLDPTALAGGAAAVSCRTEALPRLPGRLGGSRSQERGERKARDPDRLRGVGRHCPRGRLDARRHPPDPRDPFERADPECGVFGYGRPPLGGIFVASLDVGGKRLRLWSERHRTLVFSPFAGDVEAGAVAGIHVADRILPFVNLPQAHRAEVRFKPFFLDVAHRYE